MFRTILVPLDGSHFAEHALPLAASLARTLNGSIKLLQVLPPLADRYFWAPTPGSQLERDLNEHYHKRGRTYLESLGGRLRGIVIDYKLMDEHIDVPEAIDNEVASDGIDLVVMASHCRNVFQRFWLGSVADEVYRTAAAPVLLIRPLAEKVDFDANLALRRILVALDGTPRAEDALGKAMELARPTQAELLLVRTASLGHVEHAAPSRSRLATDLADDVRQEPARYLEAVAAQVRSEGFEVHTRVLHADNPAEAILKASADADLIAMETRAERGMTRFVHGSVVADVVHNTTVPVLITRPVGN